MWEISLMVLLYPIGMLHFALCVASILFVRFMLVCPNEFYYNIVRDKTWQG